MTDVRNLIAQGQQVPLVLEPGADPFTAQLRSEDPPIFLLQAAPTYQGGILPDGVWQRVPIGGAGQVLTVQGDGSVNWGNNPAGFANPMTTLGDLIAGAGAGVATRLAIGTAGQVLTVVGGVPGWATPVSGFSNPMTTLGDIITGGSAGAAGRLAIGATNQVLTVVGGVPSWANSPAGFANPMTTAGDLLFENATPAPARLAIGTAGQVLTVAGGLPSWANSPAGFTNPMTTLGDIITGAGGGAAQRLAVGAAGQVLGISAGVPAWVNSPSGFANPMTTAGDTIIGGTGGAAQRLAGGTAHQFYSMTGGLPSWVTMNPKALSNPNPTYPGLFTLPDGDFLVMPFSYMGLTGDDGAAINAAVALLPTRSEAYGGDIARTWTYGRIWLGPYQYNIQTQITLPPMVDLIGEGSGTELLGMTTGMTVVYWHSATTDASGTGVARHVCGTIANVRIDGTNAGAGAIGLDMGDGHGFKTVGVQIVNFTGAGAIGLQFCNRVAFTEKCRIDMDLLNNTTAAVFTSIIGNNNVSLEYNDITLYVQVAAAGVNGVQITGGAYFAGGSFRMRGNFGTATGPALSITGSDGLGHNSNIHDNYVDVNVECTGAGPTTINFGANVNNAIVNCTGQLSFRLGSWAASNVTTGQLAIGGLIHGDANLIAVNAAPAGWRQAVAPIGRTPGAPAGTSSATLVMMGLGSPYTPQSSGNVEVIVSGQLQNNGSGGVQYGGRWGTGGAPANGVAVTGTRFGPNSDPSVGPFGASIAAPFSFSDVLIGLTAGTAIWVDIALAAVTSGTASIKGLNVTFVELS